MKKSGQWEISIADLNGDILKQLIQYCYNGVIMIDRTNVEEMTKAATMLQFYRVTRNCVEYFSSILTASNYFHIQELADLYNLARLKKTAESFAYNNFVDVSKTKEFNQLSVDQLCVWLKSERLNVSTEDDVLKALIKWIKQDVAGRKQFLGNLLDCVRFKQVNDSVSKMLRNLSLVSCLLTMILQFQFLLDEIYAQCIEIDLPEAFLSIAARRASQNEHEAPRNPKLSFDLVYASISGIEINKYCGRGNSWTEIQKLDYKITMSAMVHRDGKVIFIGGQNAQEDALNTVYIMSSFSTISSQLIRLKLLSR